MVYIKTLNIMAEDRFTDYVDLYDEYRLSYNSDVISETIKYISNFIKIDTIADIGAGTGILTRQLLKYKFNKYYAVEPNREMQECSINKDKDFNISHLNTMANKTEIPSNTIDVIFVGTAIHWFEPHSTLKEFKRILKPNGFLILLHGGNSGKITYDVSDLNKINKEYMITEEHCTRYNKGMTNYSNKFYTIISRNPVILSIDQFIGLHMSFSTSPKKTNKIHDKFVEGLKNIYNKYAQDNKLTILSKTEVLISNELKNIN
jgi:ubiquinone/menaquinone biosynthesis C-methylase UbiE